MKALIIEDETAAALNLAAVLRQVAPGVEVVATLESVAESVEWLRANPQPDLLFMDIHLADGDSFRIFKSVEVTAPVVFTTAYDQYALEAFKVNSIDYLLKPINADDVRRALEKLRRLTSGERLDYGSRVRTMAARQSEEVFLVHVRDRIIPCGAMRSPTFTRPTKRSRPAPSRGRSTRWTARWRPISRSSPSTTSSGPTASSSSRAVP